MRVFVIFLTTLAWKMERERKHLRTAREGDRISHKLQNHTKKTHAILLGIGHCLNADAHNSDTADALGIDDCYSFCQSFSEFPCHGYATGGGVCKLYGSNALQAQRPASVSGQERKIRCYTLKQTYNVDFPFIAIQSKDFIACYNGPISWDYVHAPEGQLRGYYTSSCAKQCQRFGYFMLKSHISSNGRASSKCFCIDRFNQDTGIDRFIGNTYFGDKLSSHLCPPWNCASEPESCEWKPTWKNHVAIYQVPAPADGDPCPDPNSAHGHQSSFIYISGRTGVVPSDGWYRKLDVTSPSNCAQQCFLEGPSVQAGNQTCHGYYVFRKTESTLQCYLYSNPIPPSNRSTYLCVLRTCIKDTPCAWKGDTFRRIQGFRFTDSSTRIPLHGAHCNSCAAACSGNASCTAYQCSRSTDHCYIFTMASTDVTLQVSDVSFCVKTSTLPECVHQTGTRPVVSQNDPCRCGGEVCRGGQYCVADPLFGSACIDDCPCRYALDAPTEADQVCATTNTTYESLCALTCANETLAYDGKCTDTVCSPGVVTDPCTCKGASHSRCPVGATCFANGTCTVDCDPYGEIVCGKNGKEYPSRCSIPAGVRFSHFGPCLVPCANGETDCSCGVDKCEYGLSATTRCVRECLGTPKLADSCGCVAPCDSLSAKNNATTPKENMCGCFTTNYGYIVCDGHCNVNPHSKETQCVPSCPAPGDCACGEDICASDLCNRSEHPPKCRAMCEAADDTDCVCQKDPTITCLGGELCSRLLNETRDTSVCVGECSGLLADSAACYCRANNSVEVCHPPFSVCSVEQGDSGGKCIRPHCNTGETDCVCGKEACLSSSAGSTYCDLGAEKCYPNCQAGEAQTDCFCRGGTSNLCLSGAEDAQTTYCTALGTDHGACQPHCAAMDGVERASEMCPCGVGTLCTTEEFCLHIDSTLSGVCLPHPIDEMCSIQYDTLGIVPLPDPCFCGGMSCPAGSFCHWSGTCSSTPIEPCSPGFAAVPCRCGGDAVVCNKREQCMPGAVCLAPIERCYDFPLGKQQSVLGDLYRMTSPPGLSTKCFCGSAAEGRTCNSNLVCSSDRWTATCQACSSLYSFPGGTLAGDTGWNLGKRTEGKGFIGPEFDTNIDFTRGISFAADVRMESRGCADIFEVGSNGTNPWWIRFGAESILDFRPRVKLCDNYGCESVQTSDIKIGSGRMRWLVTVDAATGLVRLFDDGLILASGTVRNFKLGPAESFYIGMCHDSKFAGDITNINIWNHGVDWKDRCEK